MKRVQQAAGLLLVVLTVGLSVHGQQPTGYDLKVNVTDVKYKDGEIVVSLFTKSDGFPDQPSKADLSVKVSPDRPGHTFKNLPAGKYVVVVFHDRNGNGKVDKSFVGFPIEPIGLSNHPSIGPKGGPPNFDKAKVEVKQGTSIDVNLIDLGR